MSYAAYIVRGPGFPVFKLMIVRGCQLVPTCHQDVRPLMPESCDPKQAAVVPLPSASDAALLLAKLKVRSPGK